MSVQRERSDAPSSLPYALIADTMAKTLETKKGIVALFSTLFATIVDQSPGDLLGACDLILGRGASSVGSSVLLSAIISVTSASRSRIRELYRKHGDLGDVAAQLKGRQALLVKLRALTISDVSTTIRRISEATGEVRARAHALFIRGQPSSR